MQAAIKYEFAHYHHNIVCVHTVSWCDAQSQCVAGSPEDLGQVSMLQTSHRSALHCLQLVSRLNLATASSRATTTDRDEPVRHQRGCRETGRDMRHETAATHLTMVTTGTRWLF